jgi:hypothetical protein
MKPQVTLPACGLSSGDKLVIIITVIALKLAHSRAFQKKSKVLYLYREDLPFLPTNRYALSVNPVNGEHTDLAGHDSWIKKKTVKKSYFTESVIVK